MSNKLWVGKKMFLVDDEVLDYVDILEDQKQRAIEKLESLLRELKKDKNAKYPDNCEICGGKNLGVRGNENIINGKLVCDYCHVIISLAVL